MLNGDPFPFSRSTVDVVSASKNGSRSIHQKLRESLSTRAQRSALDLAKDYLPQVLEGGAEILFPATPIPYLVRKGSEAMVDLIGIEPNPGPSKSKGKSQKAQSGTQRPPGQGKSKAARQRRRAREGQTHSSSGGSGANIGLAFAPTNVGALVRGSRWSMGGRPDAHSDHDPNLGVKVIGHGLFISQINTGAVASPQGAMGGGFYTNLTPSNLEARLKNLETIYEFYVVRRVRFTYVPACSSSTSGSIALGVLTEPNMVSEIPNPSTSQVLEFESSVLSPCWQPASFELTSRGGSKTYECYAASGEASSAKIQGVVTAVSFNGAANVYYGLLYSEYEIDFYGPAPINSGTVV